MRKEHGMNAAKEMLFAFCGFTMVAIGTWFFSSRPRLFVRIFVPKDEYRDAIRPILRNQDFRRGMRLIACLQFAMAAAFGVAAIWFWFAQ
jgi:hypothetical protein